jgi:sugar/nucleoside kinase (ribokinase family)
MNPGGAPTNVAVLLAKLGMKTAFLGKVGTDRFGELLRDTLQNYV